MPIQVRWADESKQLVIAEFIGKWTIDDFSATIDNLRIMLREIPHEIYAIADGSVSKGIPRGANMIPHFKRLFMLPLAHIVVVPSSPITRVILNAFLKLNRNWSNRVTFVDSISKANEVIQRKQSEVGQGD